MADTVVERIKANNNRFREANERIRDAAEGLGAEMERIPFLCECPVEDCMQIVQLTRPEYGAVRRHPRRYITAVGHEIADGPVAEVVSRNDGYVVVEKHS